MMEPRFSWSIKPSLEAGPGPYLCALLLDHEGAGKAVRLDAEVPCSRVVPASQGLQLNKTIDSQCHQYIEHFWGLLTPRRRMDPKPHHSPEKPTPSLVETRRNWFPGLSCV